MKRNILHLVGALLSSAMITFGCSEDIPTYSELMVNETEVFIQADGETPTAIVNIISGNGNYKINVADENIATATLNGDAITINGLKNGSTTATVIDWSKHSAVINIKVKENFDLTLDTEGKVILFEEEEENQPKSKEVGILSGNGGYQVASSDEGVATAALNESGKIIITAVVAGHAVITVTDADAKTASLEVTVAKGALEVADVTNRIWKVGETSSIEILSGNPEYTVEISNESIATATIDGDNIQVTGVAAGDATLTVTDGMGLQQTMTVMVREGLKLSQYEIEEIIIDNNPTITIDIEGSGDYEIVNSCAAVSCRLSDDRSQLIIGSVMDKDVAMDATITITDKILGDEVTITIKVVNYNYETYGKGRWYIGGKLGVPSGAVANTNKPAVGQSQILAGELSGSGSAFSPYKVKNGYIIIFDGDLEIGTKTNAKLEYYVNSSKSEDITISDCEITQKDGGKYWIRFHEEGREEYSYMIVWV
ncbi:Ig-like domain-containing protein [Bacteroides congonensis]